VKYIDLFAGAGGLSEGFKRQGFTPVSHVEIDTGACFTLKTRIAYFHLKEKNKFEIYKHYLKGEISRNELYSVIPNELLSSVLNIEIGDKKNQLIWDKISQSNSPKDIDLIVGGPPCQAYSLVGRARSKTKMVDDPRNYLYIQYGRFLKKFNPKAFIFENVRGLLSANGGKYFANMQKYFRKIGFEIKPYLLNAKKFGVLQNRERVIIIGVSKDFSNFEFPEFDDIFNFGYTVSDVLDDLPEIDAGSGIDKFQSYTLPKNEYLEFANLRNGIDILTHHVARPQNIQDKKIYKKVVRKWNEEKNRLNYNDLPDKLKTHNNRSSFHDRFKVVAANETYSQTIVAHISKDGHYYIHPDINQNRSLTVREAARLQSFPDDFYFESLSGKFSRTSAFKQIGNAVPPMMAEKIAQKLKEIINDKK
jgi:DNA (cytosine-5)-methyltransferase 1